MQQTNRKKQLSVTKQMVVSALLTAIGIVIPLISPFKFVVEPFSYTLASHVPIFLAMFLSPLSAVVVCLGTTLGFFIALGSPVIAARAASHIVFAIIGALLLKKFPSIMASMKSVFSFSLLLSIIHAVCEFLVVTTFFFSAGSPNFIRSVLLFVGVGTVIHSLVDFFIAFAIRKSLQRNVRLL